MKNYKLNKTLFFLLIFGFLVGCGYEPLLNVQNQKFSIKKFSLEGNKRLGGTLRNNLLTSKKEENNLILTVVASKKNEISNKSETGKVLEYTVSISFEITAVDEKNKTIILSRVYSKKQSYAASNIHLDTLNNEKKALESMIESIANEILISLTSIYQEK
tara:strand:- start:1507 stop:1986 length:480 start_codon:yes stop_codon:yes gene_type:complete